MLFRSIVVLVDEVVVVIVEEVEVVTIVSSSTGVDTGSAEPPQKETKSNKMINFCNFI